jgi:hypothetical protein
MGWAVGWIRVFPFFLLFVLVIIVGIFIISPSVLTGSKVFRV